jgi:uncharacterized protein (DUF433 family)
MLNSDEKKWSCKIMVEAKIIQNVPLIVAEGGAIRVVGTRVNLDTIVYQFNTGASAETIVDRFPTLKLADVYAVIAYYLNNREQVETYIRGREKAAPTIRAEIEANQEDRQLVRERLLQRAAERQREILAA